MTAPCKPRQRKRTSKVKTGCEQCKRRRIKCGEQRPACDRCARANLNCSYETAASCIDLHGSQHAATTSILKSWGRTDALPALDIITLPPLARYLDGNNAMYVERYGRSVAPLLSRIGSAEFWLRTIVREMSHDDCILHCVIAIGALKYAFEAEPPKGSRTPLYDSEIVERGKTTAHYERALKSMNLAISLMRVQLQRSNEEESRRTVLITSILFIVFELMNGDPDSADGVAAKAMVVLQGFLPLYCPDPAKLNKIGRDVDDEGVEEATWLLPRLFSIRGGASGLPLHLKPRPFNWQSDSCLKRLETVIQCPGQDAAYEVFMQTWDRYITVHMLWATHVDGNSTSEGDQSRLSEQHALLTKLGTTWWHSIQQRIFVEQDSTRRLLLQVAHFFATALQFYLAHAMQPPDTTFEDDADNCLYALEIAEQILDQSEHESSFLLFNDKILPSIPNILVRCPVQQVRAKGLQLMARTLSMMTSETEGSRNAPPRNLWLAGWWANLQAENPDSPSINGVHLIKSSDSPDSDNDYGDGSDAVYSRMADQVCMRSPQSPEEEGRPSSPDASTKFQKLVLCAIATCTI
ncbi:transcriptional activator protein UGA3 [Microdochium nivale]|nr:transcriptional activator protein UGA3 [Microdochium nivale]